MTRFCYAALALLVVSAPAMAQDLADYSPQAPSAASGNSLLTLRDSLLVDTGDNSVQFGIGYGFPGGTATPIDPVIGRARRYTSITTFRVPATRTTPFALTDIRVGYRTSNVSGATSTPPRVQYDADVEPQVAVFRGRDAVLPEEDSTSAPGAVAQTTLPFTTATAISTVDQYPVPIIQVVRRSVLQAGATTVPAGLIFQPGESFTVRIQYFNVPFPQATEAGGPTVVNADSTSRGCQLDFPCGAVNLLLFNGLNVNDTAGTDAFNDQWYVRALSDDAFTTAGETGAENRAVALGQPYPNPARGMVELPFALRDAGTARISVYDVTGREVAVVAAGTFQAGGQSIDFDTSSLSAGVYAVVLQVGNERSTQRLSVVR